MWASIRSRWLNEIKLYMQDRSVVLSGIASVSDLTVPLYPLRLDHIRVIFQQRIRWQQSGHHHQQWANWVSMYTLHSLLMFYLTQVRTTSEYALIVWNSVNSTNARKLNAFSRICTLGSNSFIFSRPCTYDNFLKILKLHTLYNNRPHRDALFFISTYSGLKCSQPLLNIIGIWVISHNIRTY